MATISFRKGEGVEQRFNAAKGFKGIPLKAKALALIENLKKETRHFPHLPRGGRFAEVANTLREYEAAPGASKYAALMAMSGFTSKLNPVNYDAFTRALILSDLKRDVDSGLFTEIDDNGIEVIKELPFGLTPETLEESMSDISRYIDENPVVQEALDKRNRFMQGLRVELVANGLLSEEVLSQPASSYYHHQVLSKLAEKEIAGIGVNQSGMDVRKKGWQKGRTGSVQDYNTEYLQAEGEVLASGIQQLELINTLKKIKGMTDIKKSLEQKAAAMNLNKMIEKFGDNPYGAYKIKIAIAFDQLSRLAEEGSFDSPLFSPYSKAIQDLANRRLKDDEGKALELIGDEEIKADTFKLLALLFFSLALSAVIVFHVGVL